MNVNQLKDFLSDKPQHLGNKDSLQNQLRDSGLKQAIETQNNFASLQADKFSSSASFGVKVFSSALNSTLEVDQQKPNFSEQKSKDPESSLFDFKEVAKNVLNFISGAITNAKHSGADETELNELFEQATSGVMKGIKLAEKDLAGFMNDEIENGISQSKSLIEQGIESLRQQIFNPNIDNDTDAELADGVASTTNIAYTKLETGELSIRTRDGDQVNIRFEDLQSFELNQLQIQQLNAETVAQPEASTTKDPAVPAQPATPDEAASTAESTQQSQTAETAELIESAELTSVPEVTPETAVAAEQSVATSESSINAVYFQQQSLSFSVTGELDEEELAAIGSLVNDAHELAEEFFNGDIETAFNQALELGFDEKELTGFALQLTKVENTQVIKAYEAVSHFDESNESNEDATKAVKPVADYLDKLMNVLESSRLHLEDSKSYENLVNEMINRLGDVATPDLISAINRFNEFNQKLVDNLPLGFQPQT